MLDFARFLHLNVTMVRLFIRIKEVFLKVRLCVLSLIPIFAILCWNPYFSLPVNAVNAAELFENQGEEESTVKNSQINLSDLCAIGPLSQPLVIYNAPESVLLKSHVTADFFRTFKPEIDIFQKTCEVDEAYFSSNLASNESDNQLEVFRLKQKLNDFKYGIEYRYVGKNLSDPDDYKKKTETETKVDLQNDQQGVEIWGEKKIGSIGLKTFFSRFWDNVDRDPTHTQILTNKYGLEMKYKMDSLPINFSFSYSREESEDTIKPDSSDYQGKQKESYGGSLYYCGDKAFTMTASSKYSYSQEVFDTNEKTESFWHGISFSIRPASNLTITPMLSYGKYRYGYEERKENPSASLSIKYSRIFNVVDLSLKGGYSQTRNTDGSQDAAELDTSMGLSWDANDSFFSKISYSLELGYDQYTDKICHNSSYKELSTSFKLEFNL
jgi:hypothetical protein